LLLVSLFCRNRSLLFFTGYFRWNPHGCTRHVVAIDIDPNLLEVARHRLTEAEITNCDFVAGDAYEIARLWTRPVDFVFMANAFHGVLDRARLAVQSRTR
jgi:ubiquinone/menaquinone biosynthesis C-methylase UbiE